MSHRTVVRFQRPPHDAMADIGKAGRVGCASGDAMARVASVAQIAAIQQQLSSRAVRLVRIGTADAFPRRA